MNSRPYSTASNQSDTMKTSTVNLSMCNMNSKKRSLSTTNSSSHDIFKLKTPCSITRVVDWMGCHLVHPIMNNSEENVGEHDNSTFCRVDLKSVKEIKVPPGDSGSNSMNANNKPSTHYSIRKKFMFSRNNDSKSNFIPSSADRKKELCNYLKLMNHHEKPVVKLSKFRRSRRVKILEEREKEQKRQSENSLSGEDSDVCESLENLSETFTSKSFNDLSIIIDPVKYPPILLNRTIFNFVMPPRRALEQFEDFEESVKQFISSSDKRKERIVISPDSTTTTADEITSNGIQSTKDNDSDLKSTNNVDECSNSSGGVEVVNAIELRQNFDKNKSLNNESSRNNAEKRQTRSKSLPETRLLIDHDCFEKFVQEVDVKINGDGDIREKDIEIIKVNYDKKEKQERNDEHLLFDFHGFIEDELNSSQEIDLKLKEFVKSFQVPQTIKQDNSTVDNQVMEIVEIEDSSNDSNDEDSMSEASVISIDDNEESGSQICPNLAVSNSVLDDHDYYENGHNYSDCNILSPSEIVPRNNEVHPFENNSDVEMQSLQNLLKNKVKNTVNTSVMNMNVSQDWESENNKTDSRTNSHSISFKKENGAVISAIYVDYNFLLVQELAVSLWNQTALGNILGAQNLWLFQGCTKKLIPNKECIRKKSLESVISTEHCVAYVELWTKEHKSDFRETPIADVFATVYFWNQKLKRMDRKAVQLENIKGFAEDVQYVVLKTVREIVVSWHSRVQNNKFTQIHVYTLAPDFQSVINGRALAKIDHDVSSLHNIEDCEDLLMGCGENKITLWNLQHGYIVTSIELSDIKLSLSTLWVRCDRGYLFTLQQCVDRELRLIAINGKGSWKKLKSYLPSEGFKKINNVYIENGILISFYEEGILCWEAHTGEQIMEEVQNGTDVEYYSSGKYLIIVTEKNVVIRHAITHFLMADD